MCSSDNDYNYNYNYSYNDSSSTFKKPKRQKVPKRGPGVAELEKILRDQNRKIDHHHHHDPVLLSSSLSSSSCSSSSSSSSSPSSYHLHPHPLNFSHLNPATTANVTATSAHIPTGYFFPITSPNKPNHQLQRKHSQMVNLFVDSARPSFSTSPFYHHVEPPSNQRSYQHFASTWPQEEKMIGAKRPRSFSVDDTQIPSLIHYQVSPDQLNSSSMSHSRSNIGPTHMNSREQMLRISLDLNSKSSVTDDGNSLAFSSNPSTSSRTCDQEFSKFNPFSIQSEKKESIEELQPRSDTSSSTQKTLFHSFLSTEMHEYGAETALSLNGQRVEASSDGIDLNLKL